MYSRIAQHHMLRRGIFRPQGLNKAKRQEPCLGGKGIGYWSASPWQKQVQEERGKEEKVRGTIRQSFIVVQYQKGYSWGGGDSTELRGTWANYHLLVLRTNTYIFSYWCTHDYLSSNQMYEHKDVSKMWNQMRNPPSPALLHVLCACASVLLLFPGGQNQEL